MKKTREELGDRETVVEKIKKRRLLRFGHVERMEKEERLPISALHGVPLELYMYKVLCPLFFKST